MLEEKDLQAIAQLMGQQLKPIQDDIAGVKERLASKSRVEELESDVALLKDSIKLMRLEIEALKKAQ